MFFKLNLFLRKINPYNKLYNWCYDHSLSFSFIVMMAFLYNLFVILFNAVFKTPFFMILQLVVLLAISFMEFISGSISKENSEKVPSIIAYVCSATFFILFILNLLIALLWCYNKSDAREKSRASFYIYINSFSFLVQS